jgi:hypothetical protein
MDTAAERSVLVLSPMNIVELMKNKNKAWQEFMAV